jgi:hypothetical protein
LKPVSICEETHMKKGELVSSRTREFAIVAVVSSFALTLAVGAQEPGAPGQKPTLQQHGTTMRSMGEMMKDCRARHEALAATVDGTLLMIIEARRSKAPDKMEAALDHSEASLLKIQQDMAMCSTAMTAMQNMGIRMRELMQGGGSGSPPGAP